MKLSDFDYYLPRKLIAQTPASKRENSRLLIFKEDKIYHQTFNKCINYINEGDVLVINDTRVFPARLYGEKIPTGGKVELLLVEEINKGFWKCLAKPSRRLKPGNNIIFSNCLKARVTGRENNGTRIISFTDPSYKEKIFEIGEIPLPPYIKTPLKEKERYQTIYSKEIGSIAAPTAGLHFTETLLENLQKKGVIIAKITLHVGLGTFRPVKTDEIELHKMEKEYMEITEETIEKINNARTRGGKIIAVGTTSVRTLETSSDERGILRAGNQKTNLFIYPGYKFKLVNGIITNFHLPKSTLFMLVCAFIGIERVQALYQEAIRLKYRFYSFGDACLFFK
ncbi:MAG TPA: tRNA preQ1(34) S-adenosylmethionine ribosyltransferase-isomerase QueA [Candidatus Eremiobacteraeota bacterium]|nr:MAG: S-adenosylmethionine:tRNA ribosyltransferase-isomerase [bacterium ADurb.Bin363]HPZ07986.1 tRNA preQ1(34) S-adenosylmethionine ribosyltransferase-isomerase QueA [Candidatus Eremiobacteraeota bacterium]